MAKATKSTVEPSAKPVKKKVFKFPKSIGMCADKIYDLRAKRLEIQKQADEIEEEEKALKEYIINTLPKTETSGVSGKVANVKVVVKDVPQVKDWDAFYKHIKKTGDFDLLSRSISKQAVEARLDAKKKVPGVEIFHAVNLSITKI